MLKHFFNNCNSILIPFLSYMFVLIYSICLAYHVCWAVICKRSLQNYTQPFSLTHALPFPSPSSQEPPSHCMMSFVFPPPLTTRGSSCLQSISKRGVIYWSLEYLSLLYHGRQWFSFSLHPFTAHFLSGSSVVSCTQRPCMRRCCVAQSCAECV